MGYERSKNNGYVHRDVWVESNGPIPSGLEVDHINGNKADNRIENLRLVTHADNLKNLPLFRACKFGVHGIRWRDGNRQSWQVQIRPGGGANLKTVYYGKDFFEACCARKSAELLYGYHENHGRRQK